MVVQEDASLDFGGLIKIVIAWDHSGEGKIPYRLPLGKHWQSIMLETIVGQLGTLTKGKTTSKKKVQAMSSPNYNIEGKFDRGKAIKPKVQ